MAKRFPNIPMIAGHGGWPWLREMFCAAFFTANIYLVPDLYSVRCPGQDDVRLAAEYMLRDRMLFGSSYPLVPMDAAVKNVEDWHPYCATRRKGASTEPRSSTTARAAC